MKIQERNNIFFLILILILVNAQTVSAYLSIKNKEYVDKMIDELETKIIFLQTSLEVEKHPFHGNTTPIKTKETK